MTLVILLLAVPVIFGGIGFLALTRRPRPTSIDVHDRKLANLPRRPGIDPGER